MKNLARIALVSAAFGTAASAAPFLAIGDGAELFVTGTLGIRVDDNILFSETNEISDTIFDINPGIEITFGKNAAFSGSLTLVDSFANYSDNSKYNTNLFSGDFGSKFDDGKLKLNFSTGFHELNQNSPDTKDLVRRDEFVVKTGAEIEVSQITSVGVAVKFNHINYKPKGYGDSDDLVVPVNFYYKWTPKIDLSAGYQYRSYEISGSSGKDSTDHFFNVGARGEFTEKLKGSVAVGVTTRKFSGGDDETLPGVEGSLSYALTPKTSINAGVTNEFGTTPQGQQQKLLTFSVGAVSEIDAQWSVNANLSHRSAEYYNIAKSRTDDYFEGVVGVGYTVNSYVKLNASLTYRNNDSDLKGNSFTNNVFALSASFRY
ncbi:MAG: outer membrane beta-barrel protein [Verrucomicrobia bacterium]|nr:outer membrane beta-barrel protein [Verrucomicrobiota bacterium]